jgi:hypothetical protein
MVREEPPVLPTAFIECAANFRTCPEDATILDGLSAMLKLSLGLRVSTSQLTGCPSLGHSVTGGDAPQESAR